MIHHTKCTTSSASSVPKPITVQVLKGFPYKDNKVVPWRYEVKVCVDGSDEKQSKNANSEATNVTNIAGIGSMIRSCRIYSPSESRTEPSKETNGKEVVRSLDEERKEISDEEACKFLKLIKQSEYTMMDQLNRTLAKISLLSLMLNSEPHRKVLLKILNEAYVVHDISDEKFEGIVGNVTVSNYLTFTDEEMPTKGARHNKALHIFEKCMDHVLVRVLVDNGSSLNVMPKTTLAKLPSNESYMKPSTMVVRAFDWSHREVIGKISLPIQISLITFEVVFHVMDIAPSYSCLLGRPWIHCARAVPSTLHQKWKLIVDDKLVIIFVEEDLLVSKPSSTPYIEVTEEALETSFQGLEIVNSIYAKERKGIT